MRAAELHAICRRPGTVCDPHVCVLPVEREALQEVDAMTQCVLLAERDPRFALSPPFTPHHLAQLPPLPFQSPYPCRQRLTWAAL